MLVLYNIGPQHFEARKAPGVDMGVGQYPVSLRSVPVGPPPASSTVLPLNTLSKEVARTLDGLLPTA